VQLSNNTYPRTMNIVLSNEHYELDKKEKVKKCLVKPTNNEVAFFRLIKNEDKTFKIHIVSNSKNELHDYKRTDMFFDKYKIDNPNMYFIKDRNVKITIEESHKQYQEACKFLKEQTKNFIDLDKYPDVSRCAQYIFHCLSKGVVEPEKIASLESTFLINSFQGGLMYSNNGEYKDAVCIDQNSMYSYYMSSDKFMVPFKEGEYKYMTEEEFNNLKCVPFGIYRCIVTSTYIDLNKFFRFNKNNYYTHYDLTLAKQLKFTINIIINDGMNCLIYDSKKRIQGSKMYGSTINYLYQIKSETKDKYSKKLMSSLWGAHCEKIIQKQYINNDSSCVIENSIIDIHKYEDGNIKVITCDYQNRFKTNYGRVGTFLTSYCRLKIAETMLNNFKPEHILRVHTDGFIVVNEPEYNHLLGDNIGMFKIEHKGDVIIKNVNGIKWV